MSSSPANFVDAITRYTEISNGDKSGDFNDRYVSATKDVLEEFLKVGIPIFGKPTMEKIETTKEFLLNFLNEMNPFLLGIPAPIMGSLLSYIINPTKENKPKDIDIWIPHDSVYDPSGLRKLFAYLEKNRWIAQNYVNIGELAAKNIKFSPDIRCLLSYYSLIHEFKIQIIYLKKDVDFEQIRDRFDFEASKGFYSPIMHTDGKPIGFRATKPETIQAIKTMTTTYCEHSWDTEENDGKYTLNSRAINRLKKYQKKGYTIIASPNSKFTTEELGEFAKKEIPEEAGDSYYGGHYKYEPMEDQKKYVMANLLIKSSILYDAIVDIIERHREELSKIKKAYKKYYLDVKPFEKEVDSYLEKHPIYTVQNIIVNYRNYVQERSLTIPLKDEEMGLLPLREMPKSNIGDKLAVVYTEEFY